MSSQVEKLLHDVFVRARAKRHEFVTVEHLLAALTQEPTAERVLERCGMNAVALGHEVWRFADEHAHAVGGDSEIDTQPTREFQRVVQRAILQVMSQGKGEVTGAHLLLAVFDEKESNARGLLRKHGITRRAVVLALGNRPTNRG